MRGVTFSLPCINDTIKHTVSYTLKYTERNLFSIFESIFNSIARSKFDVSATYRIRGFALLCVSRENILTTKPTNSAKKRGSALVRNYLNFFGIVDSFYLTYFLFRKKSVRV